MTPLLLLDSAEQALGFAALIIAVVSGMVAGVVAIRRQGRKLGDMYDAIMGKEEARDASGTVFRNAQPGLAAQVKDIRDEQLAAAAHVRAVADHAVRLGALEADAAATARTQAEHARILTEHARVLTDHAQQIETLAASTVERVITRAESVQHLAMLDRAQGQPPPDDDPKP